MDNMTVEQLTNYGMNTVMSHKAFGKYAKEAIREVCNEAVRLEELLSRFISTSEISKINSSAGIKCEALSSEVYEVLSHAVEFSKCCQGFFDVTIGPLITLWNKEKDICKSPKDLMIKKILPLVDYKDLLLDSYKKTAGLRRIGQSIDLGGIGKGFAGDKFLDIFKKYGVSSAFTNIGGNVVTLGAKPDGSPWKVGVQHPRQENSLIGLVSVTDKAVVTSGDYQLYFICKNGKRYHHILDPSTGYPVEAGLISVTVVTDNSMTADALSTILFISGIEKGFELLRGFCGVEAVFIDSDLQVYITSGLIDCFQPAEGIRVNILYK